MKCNFRKNIFGWLAAGVMLSATSCKDDTFADFNNELGDEVKVTFNLRPEGVLGTRDGEALKHISDGTKADMIVYAVYTKNDDGNYIVLDEYGKGKGSGVPEDKEVGFGQTAEITTFPSVITLTLKRGEDYKVVFWAQSSKTNAYNTTDLMKVEVNYSQLTDENAEIDAVDSSSTPNNDEFRDAFCRSIDLTPGAGGAIEQNINLFRPLAQINVGTNGYDYEIATRETETKYLYSKIRINRVARYLDVLNDRTYTTTTDDEDSDNRTPEAFAVVDYGWAPIPAYNNKESESQIPTYPSYTKWDWEYKPSFVLQRDGQSIDKTAAQSIYSDEEFLRVKYEKEGANWVDKTDADGYVQYANLSDYYNKDSQTFKYLSMCYVLTSSTETEPVVVNNVKMWLATGANGENAVEVLNINHVPVQKNWRTNIIGNLLTEDNSFTIKLDKAFAGEYSGWNEGENWKWTGPLGPGAYYNGAEDVIEISSAEGLLWFQQMVNGDIRVRDAADASKIGKEYHYYSTTGADMVLNYDGISQPSDQELAQRILIATHQINNDNPEWPKSKNFHFTGKKLNEETGQWEDYPATVRLMADIDLSHVEWIPIGFDGRIGEQLGWSVVENDKDNLNTTHNNETGRIFYGIFDGNGHTIYNLNTKRFSVNVHADAQQKKGWRKIFNSNTDTRHPADNPQWFGRGLFGQIGGNAKITNVRLNNVDIYGCNGVGGVVGVAYGKEIEISNCIVDGGSIIATPMYRGDSYNEKRTFARGVYMGGIVGYFNTDGGKVDNNIVRNVYLEATRRGGGLIGSIDQVNLTVDGSVTENNTANLMAWKNQRASEPASISNNKLENLNLVVTSFTTYGERVQINQNNRVDNIAQTGFGFNTGNFQMYANKFVGGHELDADQRTDSNLRNAFKNNTASGVTFSELAIYFDDQDTFMRNAYIASIPLNHMPMLSSWYTDYVYLKDNYYGPAVAHTTVQLHDFKFWSEKATKTGYTNDATNYNKTNGHINQSNTGGTNFYYPINLPYEVDIDYIEDSPAVGMFVESVTIDGKGGLGGRSVVTPTGLTGEDASVMYVTARNRQQFSELNYVDAYWPEYMNDYKGEAIKSIKVPTVVKNMVLRGEPYANTGMLLAPNKNMHRVELYNVAIYDVYKTIALYDWSQGSKSQKVWPNWNQAYDALRRSDSYGEGVVMPHIVVKESNLRGYTVPGALWEYINYSGTTFERGASTGHGDKEYTCKVETTTTFKDCYFKAPYIIDMTEVKAGSTIKFDNSYATSTIVGSNVKIDTSDKAGCTKIVITTSEGRPVVKYYNGSTEL